MPLPHSLIPEIDRQIVSQFSPDIRSFFRLEQLKTEKLSLSSSVIDKLHDTLSSCSREKVADIEKKFAFRKGTIDLSRASTAEEKTLLILLFSAINASDELWQLQTLQLDHCQEIPEALLLRFLGQSPNIQELSLMGCKQLTPAFLQGLEAMKPERWTHLSFASTPFKGKELTSLLKKTPHLVSLDISHLEALHTSDLEGLQDETPLLRTFKMDGVTEVHGLAIVHFLSAHPEIRSLSLCSLPQFRSALLPFLRSHLKEVQNLSLSFAPADKPIYYDFLLVGEFIGNHPALKDWDLRYIHFRVNDLIYAYDDLPPGREVELKLHFREEDIAFPVGYPKEQYHDKILEIQDAYREKNVLLLL